MSLKLCACPSCNRHVRVSERVCPFCGAETGDLAARVVERAPYVGRVTRAAALVFGASLSVAACGGDDSVYGPGPDAGHGPLDAASDSVSGPGPGRDASIDAGAPDADAASDARADAPNPEPVYGPGPIDGSIP